MSQAKNMAIYTIYQRTSGGSDIGEEIVTEIFLIQRIALKCGKSVNSSENPVCLNQNQLCFNEGAELSTKNVHAHFHGTIFSILRTLCDNQMFLYSVPNLC